MFLKNKNIIFKTRRSKVTDYAALRIICTDYTETKLLELRSVGLNHILPKLSTVNLCKTATQK